MQVSSPSTLPVTGLPPAKSHRSADLSPLSNETLKVIKKNIFNNHDLSDGIQVFQTFAKKVTKLENLRADFESGKITSKRALSVAKCVGVALLVTLAVTAAAGLFFFAFASGFPLAVGTGFIAVVWKIFYAVSAPLLAASSLPLLVKCCKKSHELMQLNPQKVQIALQQLTRKKFSPQSIQQVTEVENRLNAQIEKLQTTISDRKKIGDQTGIDDLAIKKVSLTLALNDVVRLHNAVEARVNGV